MFSQPEVAPAGRDGRIVPVAVIIAAGGNADGRREVLGMDIGPSKAETLWTGFLRKLARRGLRRVKLVIDAAHERIKAAYLRCRHTGDIGLIVRLIAAKSGQSHMVWQRRRAVFMRPLLFISSALTAVSPAPAASTARPMLREAAAIVLGQAPGTTPRLVATTRRLRHLQIPATRATAPVKQIAAAVRF